MLSHGFSDKILEQVNFHDILTEKHAISAQTALKPPLHNWSTGDRHFFQR